MGRTCARLQTDRSPPSSFPPEARPSGVRLGSSRFPEYQNTSGGKFVKVILRWVVVSLERHQYPLFRRNEGALETEDGLKINAAVCRLRRGAAAEDATQRVRLVEERRSDDTARRPQIYVVHSVACIDAKGEVVALGPCIPWTKETAAPATSTGHSAATHATPATETTAAPATSTATASAPAEPTATTARRRLSANFFPKGKGLAQAQVQSELSGTREVIDGDQSLVRLGCHVERAEAGCHEIGTRSAGGGEGGPGVAQDPCPIHVRTHRNVKRCPRGGDQERAQAKAMRQIPGTRQKEPVANVEGGSPVTFHEVVWVHGDTGIVPRGVGISVVERVIAKQRKLGAQTQVEIANQLVLSEEAYGIVLIEIPEAIAQWPHTGLGVPERKRSWKGRVEIIE